MSPAPWVSASSSSITDEPARFALFGTWNPTPSATGSTSSTNVSRLARRLRRATNSSRRARAHGEGGILYALLAEADSA
jgi:hypothetical protein